jgi:hypothetical protein
VFCGFDAQEKRAGAHFLPGSYGKWVAEVP